MKTVLVRALVCAALLTVIAPATASAGAAADYMKAVDAMMLRLAPASQRDAQTIKRLYRSHLDLLFLDGYADLEGALATGGLAPLPVNAARFNLRPRLDGAHPIGEMDLPNQASYTAARPATIGALIAVASRVKSGPIEVTSLVRHGEYQNELRASNGNATTSVPMHTMGLAFDIALINTPLSRVYEIRDVLLEMRAAGDILFIGEQQQLVFHVVPHPSRLGYFTDVYAQAVGSVSGTQVVEVVAPGPPRLHTAGRTPHVVADVVAVMPHAEHWNEWWAAVDAAPRESNAAAMSSTQGVTTAVASMALFRGLLAFLAALLATVWRITVS
jgi:hypothetical protein